MTITAAVTKGSETVNVGAQLTVTSEEEPVVSGDPAFIVISSIGTGAEEGIQPAQGWGGSLAVGVNVERGDQTIERVSLLVDGAVVDLQSFGTSAGMTPPEDEAAEQAIHAFTLAFGSHDRETGVPTYMNGEHTISAELQIQGEMGADGMMGHQVVPSNAVAVEFDNDSFIAASVGGLGEGAMNSETGQIWR